MCMRGCQMYVLGGDKSVSEKVSLCLRGPMLSEFSV